MDLHVGGVGQTNCTNIPMPFVELADYLANGVIAAIKFQLSGHINHQVKAPELLQLLFQPVKMFNLKII